MFREDGIYTIHDTVIALGRIVTISSIDRWTFFNETKQIVFYCIRPRDPMYMRTSFSSKAHPQHSHKPTETEGHETVQYAVTSILGTLNQRDKTYFEQIGLSLVPP